MAKNEKKAFLMFSGGLDSMLAAKVLEEQGLVVIGVCFKSNFFNADRAKLRASRIGISLEVVDISEEVLSLVKRPISGYGKNMNPCIDCHALMARKTRELFVDNYPGSILATGEVVGQRPFSQNREAMLKVSELAGFEIIRPLSALHMPETEAEKNGFIKRDGLLGLSGRNRGEHFKLAEKYGISDYPSPAGGCLLTDGGFSIRLKEMIGKWPNCAPADVELLKYGRIFWFMSKQDGPVATIIARNENECVSLEDISLPGDIIISFADKKGPVSLIRGLSSISDPEKGIEIAVPDRMDNIPEEESASPQEIVKKTAALTGYYKPSARGCIKNIIVKRI